MNKINNPAVPILIMVICMLTFDYLYKNHCKDTESDRNGDIRIEETVPPGQSCKKENPASNAFACPQSFSEKDVQSCENIEIEGADYKFAMGIIL
jgi:hypothetical protein